MSDLLNRWIKIGVKNSLIAEGNEELVEYGLYQLITYILFFVCQLIILKIFHCILGGVIFITAFVVLRRFIGGYHANTRIMCFIYSNALSLFYGIFSRIHIDEKKIIIALLMAVVILLILAPVDNANKKLSSDEFIKYKNKARIVLFAELAIIMVSRLMSLHILEEALMYAIIFGSVFVISGYVKSIVENNT